MVSWLLGKSWSQPLFIGIRSRIGTSRIWSSPSMTPFSHMVVYQIWPTPFLTIARPPTSQRTNLCWPALRFVPPPHRVKISAPRLSYVCAIYASCQLICRGRWAAGLEVYPTGRIFHYVAFSIPWLASSIHRESVSVSLRFPWVHTSLARSMLDERCVEGIWLRVVRCLFPLDNYRSRRNIWSLGRFKLRP